MLHYLNDKNIINLDNQKTIVNFVKSISIKIGQSTELQVMASQLLDIIYHLLVFVLEQREKETITNLELTNQSQALINIVKDVVSISNDQNEYINKFKNIIDSISIYGGINGLYS